MVLPPLDGCGAASPRPLVTITDGGAACRRPSDAYESACGVPHCAAAGGCAVGYGAGGRGRAYASSSCALAAEPGAP